VADVARVLVTEEIAEGGLDRLREAGHQVDVRLGLSPEDLLAEVRGAHALIVRSTRPRTLSSSAGPASGSTTSTWPPPRAGA